MPNTKAAPVSSHIKSLRRAALALLATGLIAALFVFGCQSDESEEEAASPLAENAEVLLNIGVERGEDLPSGAFEDLEIEVPGREIWQPDLAHGGDSRAFGQFPVEETHSFIIYPEGRDGAAIEVPFTMKETMISGTAQSKTYVTLHGDSIVVRGPAISEEREVFSW